MSETLTSDFKYHPAITAAIIILFICGWSVLYMEVHFDIDIGWLLQCLDRFIAGGTYNDDFYETNPPLSFLIYLPAYPLYSYLGISAKAAVTILFTIYIAISSLSIYSLIQKSGYGKELAFTIASAFIIVTFWAGALSFASKDHLVFIFLAPLCLAQYIITTGQNTNKSAITAAIIMGGIAICLKPHYAIVPAIFFLHRLITTRQIFKADFFGLLAIGIAYLAFIYIYTPEYIDIMLPEIASIYGTDKPFPISSRFGFLIYTAIAIALGFLTPRDSHIRCMIFSCAALSLICVIPYYIQMKGFHYQALPFLSFGMVALFLAIFTTAKSISKYSDIAIWISCIIIIAINAPFIANKKSQPLTQGQFYAQPLVETIDDLAWNKVYASYDFKSQLSTLPYITDLENGSRFGQLWPLHGLSQMSENTSDEQEKALIRRKMMEYVDMIAIDMALHSPSVITIPQYRALNSDETNRNYLNFLMKNDNFKNAMENYKFYDTIPYNTSLTFNNTDHDKIVMHDVYVLKIDME